MTKPVVAIVGRPNVGKSTFFNRCIGGRVAIVHDMPGSTRDRIYREVDWAGHNFLLIDTGGLIHNDKDKMTSSVNDQVKLAISEADIIIFMVDGKAGLSGKDTEIANMLRRTNKPVLVAVNKVDGPEEEVNTNEFYKLGLGEPIGLSSRHGSGGVGDLLDLVINLFKGKVSNEEDIKSEEESNGEDQNPVDQNKFSLALVGRPNVGKSSIINLLCGDSRSIVDSEPGTTRDAIDTSIKWNDKEITIIDTAGIRRKSKVDFGVEAFSVVRSLNAIERADVVILVLDATQEIADQDQKIAAKINDAGKAIVIVYNKWDLIEDRSSSSMNNFIEEAKHKLRHIAFAPILFVSAIDKLRINKILEASHAALLQGQKRISTGLLNQVINEAAALTPPPSASRGRRLRIYYTTQVQVSPPTFILFANDDKLLTQNYHVYLERKIREAFGFVGTSIRLIARPKNSKN